MANLGNLPGTYSDDSRRSLDELYESYERLKKAGWKENVVFEQRIDSGSRTYNVPIVSLQTETKGRALWTLAGVHGEEPAGSSAIEQGTWFEA